jgi:hypothetical protein
MKADFNLEAELKVIEIVCFATIFFSYNRVAGILPNARERKDV